MTRADLDAHRDMVIQLNKAERELESMQCTVLSAQRYDGMPHAHNVHRSTERQTLLIDKALDRVAHLEQIVKRSEESGISAWIDAITDTHTMVVFYYWVICGMSWQEVADRVGGLNTKESVSQTYYRYLKAKGIR